MTVPESVIVIAPGALRERIRTALDAADIHFVFADDDAFDVAAQPLGNGLHRGEHPER